LQGHLKFSRSGSFGWLFRRLFSLAGRSGKSVHNMLEQQCLSPDSPIGQQVEELTDRFPPPLGYGIHSIPRVW
jgi:hypothetical protein